MHIDRGEDKKRRGGYGEPEQRREQQFKRRVHVTANNV